METLEHFLTHFRHDTYLILTPWINVMSNYQTKEHREYIKKSSLIRRILGVDLPYFIWRAHWPLLLVTIIMMMLPMLARAGAAARAASRSEVWPWSLLAAVAALASSPSPICSEMMTNPYLTPRAAHNIHSNVNELACHLSVNRSVILSSMSTFG